MKPFQSIRAGLTPGQKRMLRMLVFLVRLAALSLPLYLVIWLGLDLYPLQLAVASQSAWLLQATGHQVVRDGALLTVNGGFVVSIVPDCTGWKSMLFLSALIFAVPGIAMRKRLAGLLGLPLVWLGNLTRVLAGVAAQGAWGTDAALAIHDWLFQAGLVAMVLGVWTAWLMWAEGRISIPAIRRKDKA
jgi:exosortase/archaeosortase family protein